LFGSYLQSLARRALSQRHGGLDLDLLTSGGIIMTMKRFTTYFLGAGLTLSVTSFTPAAFAQGGAALVPATARAAAIPMINRDSFEMYTHAGSMAALTPAPGSYL
jgi:hypothetical protein